VKFGLPLFGLSPHLYAGVAVAAEEHGFESVWMPEHLVFPETMPTQYPYTDDGLPSVTSSTPLYDPWVVLAYVAHATTSIRLATGVYILPLRHPLATARSVVTLDRLSNGRVTLGCGVGWLEPEFTAVGESFRTRGARTDEIIPLLRRLWSEDVISHDGDHICFDAVRFEPKPRQAGGIPIEVGGNSPAALRRAGRLGDGWIEIGATDLTDVARDLAVIQRHRRDAGRADRPFEVTVSGAAAGDLDAVRACADIGVTRVMASLAFARRPTPESLVEAIARYADDVIAQA
jgi:probable F420-dependent oxidoreductase